MSKWTRRTTFISSYNRYVDAIMEGEKFITECGCLSELFISNLIAEHNESIDRIYQRGLYEGIEIIKEVYKGVLK